MKRSQKILLGLVPVVAFLVAAKLMNTSPPTNIARTAPDAEAALKTRIYKMPSDKVEDAAKKVIYELKTYGKSWNLPYTARAEDSMTTRHIDVEVPVIVFTDDLTVTLETVNEGTKVDVVSSARLGKGDFGENRRHIIQFLSALDAEVDSQSK